MRKPRAPRPPRDTRSYVEILRDPRWQKKRLEIMQRDGWSCVECRATDKTLQVHHYKYEWGKAPWEIGDIHLGTLCEDCHAKATLWGKRLKDIILPGLDLHKTQRVVGYALGMMMLETPKNRMERSNDLVMRGVADAAGLAVEAVFAALDEGDGGVDGYTLLALKGAK